MWWNVVTRVHWKNYRKCENYEVAEYRQIHVKISKNDESKFNRHERVKPLTKSDFFIFQVVEVEVQLYQSSYK